MINDVKIVFRQSLYNIPKLKIPLQISIHDFKTFSCTMNMLKVVQQILLG